MTIDDPATLAEVEAAFAAYEAALVGNDVAALDGFFWRDARAPPRPRPAPPPPPPRPPGPHGQPRASPATSTGP